MSNQVEKAAENHIALTPVEISESIRCITPLLTGEIPGATVFFNTMLKGDKVFFEASPEILKTYFLLKGRITFLADSKTYPFDERAAFVADPNKALEIDCEETAHFFEIQWRLNEEDRADLSANQLKVPLVQVYNECKQYRETFKSPKTHQPVRHRASFTPKILYGLE